MNEYDFSRLNDKEFEVLCTDLLSAELGVRFERFKPGRDGGVDGRYFTPADAQWVLQSKHWVTTPFSKLLSELAKTEAPKLAKLKPARYVLMVSHGLSATDKAKLSDCFRAHTTCPIDVYGREDLNDMLSRHPQVEKRHFKLWITSSSVLSNLLNNGINGRSDSLLQDIIDKSQIYVQTANYGAAWRTLEGLGTVIITGEAGIGKTTLAEQLILSYASTGYELVCISDDIQEAEQAYTQDRLQLFYFDDFLGRNYLEALTGHEGTQIVGFIKRVARDISTKKFILTSRSTILNQGRILNDVFDNNNIKRNEFEIRLTSLSSLDKAQILYNHLWHSDLGDEYIDQLYAEKRYLEVIEHKNYNPRLIAFITDAQRLSETPASRYWSHVASLLKNPADVWEHPFASQLDDYGQIAVLLVAFSKPNLTESQLSAAYARAISLPAHSNLRGKRDFRSTVKHLTNSLLNRILLKNQTVYRLFNPSLGDFLLHRYKNDSATLKLIFEALESGGAIDVLLDMSRNRFIDEPTTYEILSYLYNSATNSNNNTDQEYIAKLCTHLGRREPNNQSRIARIKNTATLVLAKPAPQTYQFCATVIIDALEIKLISPDDIEAFTLEALDWGVTEKEIPLLGNLIYHLEGENTEYANERFEELAKEHMLDSLDHMFEEYDIFQDSEDLSRAEYNLKSRVADKLRQWKVLNTEDVIEEVVDTYELSDRMYNYFNPSHTYTSSPTAERKVESASIIDLFQRDR